MEEDKYSASLFPLTNTTTMALTEISRNKTFGGYLIKYQHTSDQLQCDMKFNVFLPKVAVEEGKDVPGIYFLSGLTCTEDNFMQKSGAIAEAAKHQVALIAPDTSPRGVEIEGDRDSWDFGVGKLVVCYLWILSY